MCPDGISAMFCFGFGNCAGRRISGRSRLTELSIVNLTLDLVCPSIHHVKMPGSVMLIEVRPSK